MEDSEENEHVDIGAKVLCSPEKFTYFKEHLVCFVLCSFCFLFFFFNLLCLVGCLSLFERIKKAGRFTMSGSNKGHPFVCLFLMLTFMP